jgi:feruloyl esterase
LKDGLIDDPRACRFDPQVLACKGADGADCLTGPQVAAARKIYSPAINPRTGKEMFASLVPGTELGWGAQAQGPEPNVAIYDQYRYVVFKDPNWDWKTFDFDKDVARGDLPENLPMNATNPDMKAFFSRGGKLFLYHGWSDSQVAAVNTIKYYDSVVHVMGAADASKSVRLFMAPGMGHCAGPVDGGANCQRQGRSHPSVVRVSASGQAQGRRQHGRRRELRLQGAVAASATPSNRGRGLCPFPSPRSSSRSGATLQ